MFIIIDARTNQKANIGSWITLRVCEDALRRMKRDRPEDSQYLQIKEIE